MRDDLRCAERKVAKRRGTQRVWSNPAGDLLARTWSHPQQGRRLPTEPPDPWLGSGPPVTRGKAAKWKNSWSPKYVERPDSSTHRTHTQVSKPASPLDNAYEELDRLLVERLHGGSSAELESQIDRAWEQLRTLQEQEIRVVEAELESAFELPPSELERLAREARALLADDDE